MFKGRRPTLRDVRQQRGQQEFVGRGEELALFESNFGLLEDDERRKYLINISGQSGVGKTTLLKHFQRMADKMGAATAWTDHDDQDAVWVMGGIYNQLRQSRTVVPLFEDTYNRYLTKLKEQEVQGGQPKSIFAFAGTLAKAAFRLGKLVPKAKPALDLIDEDTAMEEAKELIKRELRKEDYDLVTYPREVLTPLFLDALAQFAEDGPVVLFFDTYEVTRQYLELWLLDIFDFKYGDVPANLTFVIAGQSELDPIIWERHAWLLERQSLAEFSEQEARAYLALRGITEERLIQTIMGLSARLPALLALLATSKPDNPDDVIDPSDSAVKRFLKGIDDPLQRNVVLDASLARRLDRDIVGALVGEEDADAVFEWLKQRPFVVKSHVRWAYHEVVRSLVVRQRREDSTAKYRQTHLRLAEHYDTLSEKAVAGPRAQPAEYTSEALYHHLCGEPTQDMYLLDALSAFASVYGINPAHSRLLATAIQQAGEDAPDARLLALGRDLMEAVNHHEKKQYEEGAKALRHAAEQVPPGDHQRAGLLGLAALLFIRAQRYAEAEVVLNRALMHASNDIVLYTERVYLYRSWGRPKDAQEALDTAKAMDSQNVLVLIQAVLLAIQSNGDIKKYVPAFTSMESNKQLRELRTLYFSVYFDDLMNVMESVQARLAEHMTRLVQRSHSLAKHEGELELVLTQADEGVREYPSNGPLRAERGNILLDLGRNEEAASDLRQAIALDGSLRVSSACSLGLALSRCGRYAEAIEAHRVDQVAHPNHFRPLYNIAVATAFYAGVEGATAEVEDARRALETALDTPATRDMALYGIAGLAALRGDREQALRLLAQTIPEGTFGVRNARQDIAWSALRDDPLFVSLLSGVVPDDFNAS